jgi:hypothetical protein
MSKIVLVVIVLLIGILVGGAAYLAFFDIPAPTTTTKIVLPDARFPQ